MNFPTSTSSHRPSGFSGYIRAPLLPASLFALINGEDAPQYIANRNSIIPPGPRVVRYLMDQTRCGAHNQKCIRYVADKIEGPLRDKASILTVAQLGSRIWRIIV